VNHAVVLAGGRGERFWPLSRRNRPKQLLTLLGDRTMLESTLARIAPVVPVERTVIVTHRSLVEEINAAAHTLPAEQILAEEVGRNTAPAIGLACLWISRRDPAAVVLVTPSDHYVERSDVFDTAVRIAFDVAAREDLLLTFAVRPTRPETGYGYIELGPHLPTGPAGSVYSVASFEEKPPLRTAKRFVREGRYYWNSGMFVFRASLLLQTLEVHLPGLAALLEKVRPHLGTPREAAAIRDFYLEAEAISIDYGVMEKAGNVAAVKVDFGWDDLGTLVSLERVQRPDAEGNTQRGKVLGLDVHDCILIGEGGIVAAFGVRDLIIVHTPDATLVMPRDRASDLKQIVEALAARPDGKDFL
jgi:mannose-1-phosphate guanylyltransferase